MADRLYRKTLGMALLSLPLAACQVLTPQPPSQGRLLDTTASAAPAPRVAAPGVVYTVKRGTIREVLNIPGRVVPARSAAVVFPVGGTVSAVHARSGQQVKAGDVLAELAVDESVLEAGRTRATLAELAYESQQAKVDALRAGAGTDTLEAARADLVKVETDLQKAQVARQIARQTAQQDADQRVEAQAAQQDAADRQVSLAELTLQQATDDLQEATAAVARLDAQAKDQAADQAAQAADAAAVAARAATVAGRDADRAVRAAQRHADEASIKLAQAQTGPSASKMTQDMASQQLHVTQAQDELREANAAVDEVEPAKDPTGVIAANAVASVRAINRRVAAERATLAQMGADLATARATDERELELAQLELNQTKDDLAAAQQAKQDVAAGQPAPSSGIAMSGRAARQAQQAELAGAQAKVRAAQRAVEVGTLKLEEARKPAASGVSTSTVGVPASTDRLAELDITAQTAGVAAARAKLAALQQGPPSDELVREEKQASLLQDEANAARQSGQPVLTITAPFDATVTSVDISPGQAIDARVAAVNLAGIGGLSVLARPAESEVTQLAVDQSVNVSFPGLGAAIGTGSIADISGSASTSSSVVGTVADTQQVTYPVRVELTSTPPALKLGMTAVLNVVLREASDVLYVPTNAVRTVEGRTMVTAVAPDGQVTDAPVGAGATFGTDVEILAGLKAGDVVAVFTTAGLAKP